MKTIKYLLELNEKMKRDHITAFASQGAFFLILSFFPFLMFLLTLTRILPVEQADITRYIVTLFPQKLSGYIVKVVDELYTKASPTVNGALKAG